MLDTLTTDKLVEVLNQEAAVYEDILKISRNKTNIIVEGKVSELESLVKLEQSLVLKMSRLEASREKLVEKLASELGIESQEPSISEIMERLGADETEKLKSCQLKMSEVLGEVKNLNGLNSKLIKNSLDYIDFSINLLTAAGSPNDTYGNTGHINDSKKRSFFDKKL